VIQINADGIPEELRHQDRWVAWGEEGAIDVKTGNPAYTVSPDTWSTFAAALAYANEHSLGVAYALHDDGRYASIDLNGGMNPTTLEVHKVAAIFIEPLSSFTEVYPERDGVRVVVRGPLPVGTSGFWHGTVEVYDRCRFLPLTGARLAGTPTTIESRPRVVSNVWKALYRYMKQKTLVSREPDLSDEQVVAKAKRANKKFARLWKGDTSGYDFSTQADMALMTILAFWTHRNPARMASLFEESEAGQRKEWKKAKYRESTIRRALDLGKIEPRRFNQENQEESGEPSKSGQSRISFVPGRAQEENKQAMDMAVELAASLTKAPCGEAAFKLARRLHVLADSNPEQFEQEVRGFCDQTGHDCEELRLAFLASWDKVRIAEGDDVLAWAFKQAKEKPYHPSPCLSTKYALVASTAYHLADCTKPKPFYLPCERLAALLETSAMTVSNIIQLLKKNGVIKCVKEDYKYSAGVAKEYVFTGK
jgi:hypothetical protein